MDAAVSSFDPRRAEFRRVAADRLVGCEAALSYCARYGLRSLGDHYAELLEACEGLTPDFSAFRPERLGRDLTHVAVLDVEPDGDMIFRLVGETYRSRFNENPVGNSYLNFVAHRRRPLARESGKVCAFTPCVMVLNTGHLMASGRVMQCRGLVVPFQTGGRGAGSDGQPVLVLLEKGVEGAPTTILIDGDTVSESFVTKRIFVDIGAGAPNDFCDDIPTAFLPEEAGPGR